MGVGCTDARESGTDAEMEPTGSGGEVTVPIAAIVTNVVDPGAEPRTLLRPSFETGTAQQVTLRTEHHIEEQIGDQPMHDSSPPAITIPLTATTDREGVDLTLGAATSTDPELAEQLGIADGSRAGFEMSELGAITALRMKPTPATPDAARTALEQAFFQAVYQSIAFPTDPVGEGAVWTVHQQVYSAGAPLDQVTTATLTKRDGNLLTLALDVVQIPKSDVWHLPNNAGPLEIIDYVMHGTGVIMVDLGLPLPVSGSVTVGGHQSYEDPRGGVLLRQDISTQVHWGD
nr:hypothetical protein [Nocardia sp. BMG51109]